MDKDENLMIYGNDMCCEVELEELPDVKYLKNAGNRSSAMEVDWEWRIRCGDLVKIK